MGRGPCTCCSNAYLNRGPWTPEEDALLMDYIKCQGDNKNWRKVPKAAGLLRCGKSCRLRWLNYLRPDIKRGKFSEDETDLIIRLHSLLGNRWSIIAGRVPGRSDNEIKNYWNFHLSKKLLSMGIDPKSHKPLPSLVRSSGRTGHGLDNSTTNLHNLFSRNTPFSSVCSSSLEASYSGSNSNSRSSSCGFKLEPDHDNVCQQPWSNLMRIEVLQPDQQEDQQEQKQKQKLRDRAQTGTGGSDRDSQGEDNDLNIKISNSSDNFVPPDFDSEYLDNFVPPDFDSSDDGMSTRQSLDFLDALLLETDGMLEFIGDIMRV